MNEFDINKRYVFDLNTALEKSSFKANYNSGNSTYWADYCHGKEVTVIDEFEGKIESPTQDYIIMPWWCREVT